ncbi:MAG: holo-ACP synthase [Deltaproteobacteria bacterium]|nr:holo-ACP synthase [Deltaproteobacteria bacterium]
MILGVGLDLIEVSRVESAIRKQGAPFLERIGRPAEHKAAPAKSAASARRAEYWAARFAAKEAFAKALGTGIGATVPFRSVGVVKSASGKPELEYSLELKRVLKRRGVTKAHLSLTHTAQYAAAMVVLEGKGTRGK